MKYTLRKDGNMTIIEADDEQEAYSHAVAYLTCGLNITQSTQEEIDWYDGFTGEVK